MELSLAPDSPLRQSLSTPTFSSRHRHLLTLLFPLPRRRRTKNPIAGPRFLPPTSCVAEADISVPIAITAPEHAGGKMVMELVGAFNELTERMNVLSTSSSRLLFKSLKLSIPILQSLPLAPDGRSPLSKALSVAMVLADLQVVLVVVDYASVNFPEMFSTEASSVFFLGSSLPLLFVGSALLCLSFLSLIFFIEIIGASRF